MSEIFLQIINMSISASWIVLAVLLLRLLFKKAPKWISVLLWGIVAVRLICPFSIESPFSLVPDANPINTDIFTEPITTGISIENANENNTGATINESESEIVNGIVIAPETGAEIEA
ncbi:MAG: M56 family metallopeptidase, partial [Acutalibacteraceae bacterium]